MQDKVRIGSAVNNLPEPIFNVSTGVTKALFGLARSEIMLLEDKHMAFDSWLWRLNEGALAEKQPSSS